MPTGYATMKIWGKKKVSVPHFVIVLSLRPRSLFVLSPALSICTAKSRLATDAKWDSCKIQSVSVMMKSFNPKNIKKSRRIPIAFQMVGWWPYYFLFHLKNHESTFVMKIPFAPRGMLDHEKDAWSKCLTRQCLKFISRMSVQSGWLCNNLSTFYGETPFVLLSATSGNICSFIESKKGR